MRRIRAIRVVASTGSTLAIFLATAPVRAAEEVLPADPRMILASSLLSNKNELPRAIELYREVLAEKPEDVEARLWLARVLSWEGEYEESLGHYRWLEEFEEPPASVREERAEVLSWAGRTEEAETAFGQLLHEDPNNARAALGLARVYKWSGRNLEASKAYQRALALKEDTEARREFEELTSRRAVRADSDTRYLRDSDDFELKQLTARSAVELSLATRLLAAAGFTHIRTGQGSSGTSSGWRENRAFDATLGLERDFGHGLRASAEGGARIWDQASDRAMAHAKLEYTPLPSTLLGLAVSYQDFLAHSDSFLAVQKGLTDVTLGASGFHRPTRGLQTMVSVEVGFVSDSNRRISTGLGAWYRPWEELDLRFGVAAHTLHYTKESDYYYDPALDVEARAEVAGSYTFFQQLGINCEFGIGPGYASQDKNYAFGFSYFVAGGLAWQGDRWRVSLRGSRSQSQRGSTYTAHGAGIAVTLGF